MPHLSHTEHKGINKTFAIFIMPKILLLGTFAYMCMFVLHQGEEGLRLEREVDDAGFFSRYQ